MWTPLSPKEEVFNNKARHGVVWQTPDDNVIHAYVYKHPQTSMVYKEKSGFLTVATAKDWVEKLPL